MRIHLIAIGGSAMHNLALALHHNGHHVSGSDDEIYNPARDRLQKYGLLPKEEGWNPTKITPAIEAIIVGMHAHSDNPELAKAQELGIPIYSYPSFLAQHAKEKQRIVVAGSHGKTSTTSIIMHVLQKSNTDFDYLVGAQIEGFDTMVRLSDAPTMIIEGDEYLSSPLDRRPKILHYTPQIAILTGIAWDHMNVFPTFENYRSQFRAFLETMPAQSTLFYYAGDPHIPTLLSALSVSSKSVPYSAFPHIQRGSETIIQLAGQEVSIPLFGQHNLENLQAAYLVLREMGISDEAFLAHIPSFTGAARRLQKLGEGQGSQVYLDFAHAPSKVKATTQAYKAKHGDKPITAVLELHTYSSLNQDFLPEYEGSLEAADRAVVFYSPHTIKMKRLAPLSAEKVKKAFQREDLLVFEEAAALKAWLEGQEWSEQHWLFMSSGKFGGIDLKELVQEQLTTKEA